MEESKFLRFLTGRKMRLFMGDKISFQIISDGPPLSLVQPLILGL